MSSQKMVKDPWMEVQVHCRFDASLDGFRFTCKWHVE